jgi:ribose transport system ATP-binding protein
MENPILEVRKVSKRFGATQALSGIDLSFYPGSVHAIIGENGAGKSTLMNIIGGVHQADSGEVLLEGREVKIHDPTTHCAWASASCTRKSPSASKSVAENIHMPMLDDAGRPLVAFKEINRVTRELLADFDTHAHINPRQKVSELSVSQQQVVEIVKALTGNCKVLILDEPTAALTQTETEVLFRIIQTLKAKGLAILYISHRLAEIYQIADTISVLRDGQLIGTRPASQLDQLSLVHMMVGRELKDIYPDKAHDRTGEVLLEVKGLAMEGVFSGVDFDLRRGEILGFAGLVGSGRTEVARAICGLYRKSAGEVRLGGRRLEIRSYKDAIRQGLVYLTENRASEGLFLEMNVANNISVIDLDAVAQCRDPAQGRASLARRFVEEMQIKVASVAQKLRSLSGGNQQKVLVSKLLTISPKVVIMDEPTRGIDIGAKTQIYHLLRRLSAEGVGVIMISSELPEVVGVCDRVLVMYEGRQCGILEGGQIDEKSIIQLACLSPN